jgi:short subunit fatty acid transporter
VLDRRPLRCYRAPCENHRAGPQCQRRGALERPLGAERVRHAGFRVSLNIFNFAFLFLALLLHPSPASFSAAASRGATYLHGIIIQFPLYAGMYGLIHYSGLAETIGHWFVSIAGTRTFPIIVYWYSGILSDFIPSGGSKWAVEAPYVLSAANALGVPARQAILGGHVDALPPAVLGHSSACHRKSGVQRHHRIPGHPVPGELHPRLDGLRRHAVHLVVRWLLG